ncbi:MAG: class I SAM-dependent methyltransferase, partial [Deltaproteobacteria bacterium]|nr:class I SAM-dependent methyltransferase [Deltaproteobacteria bacterium]
DIFPLQQPQVAFIDTLLPPTAAVLDAGCATGSLAIALSAAAHRVTGIDLSSALLQIAQQKVKAQKASVALYQRDMLHLFPMFQPGQFHAVTCMGNTLSHLPPQGARLFFQHANQVLTTTGVLIFQIINCDRLLQLNLSTLPDIDNSHVLFERTYIHFDGASPFTFRARMTVKSTDLSYTVDETLYPYSAQTLHDMLVAAGFCHIVFYGNYACSPIGVEHQPLIAVAKK